MARARRLAVLTLIVGFLLLRSAGADEVPFQKGDVFASVENGEVLHFDRDGNLKQTLNTGRGSIGTGMCFDAEGTLYVTNFSDNSISTFNRRGRLDESTWASSLFASPESCVMNGKGQVLTGSADGDRSIRILSARGKVIEAYQVASGPRGTDWIDLAADQCTVYYTSEGSTVKAYDICKNKQLPDFATNLGESCYALRLRANGELMVTCESTVYRFDARGKKVTSYVVSGDSLFAMNLDPDGETFWTAGQASGNVYRIDIETGRGTRRPLFNIRDGESEGGFVDRLFQSFRSSTIGGLAVYGERTAAQSVAVDDHPEPPEPQYVGSVELGTPSDVDFGRVAPDSLTPGGLDLAFSKIDGNPLGRVTSDFDVSGAVLEIETPEGWRALGRTPVDVPLTAGSRQLPLRLRAGRCPRGSLGKSYSVYLEAPGANGSTAKLQVPLSLSIDEPTWLLCWWPVLAGLFGLLALAFVVYGFISPSRFSPRVGVVLSPEDNMDEGFFHPIRPTRGSGSGFYRDARVYVSPSFRLSGKGGGALVRLRAQGKQIKIQPVQGSSVMRQNVDGEWEPLPVQESGMRFGTVYRDEMKTIFFELRNG